MPSTDPGTRRFPDVSTFKRRAVCLSSQRLVSEDYLKPDKPFPLLIQPATDDIDLIAWATSRRDLIETRLLNHGAILFRGFKIDSVSRFEQFARVFSSELLDYFDQHTPRSRVQGKIYTSTEYPADHMVPFHSENSKNSIWPMNIWFCCLHPAQQGGETPIADNRQVFKLIPPRIRERFMQRQVMYVRNFGDGLGLPWQRAFQTTDPSLVEQMCREAGMQWEWKDWNRLRVRHVCQAVSQHPRTGEMVWFNQAHLFHISNVEPAVRETLLSSFKQEDLPSNAYYGDGSAIEAADLDEIREAFWRAAVTFPWEKGDVLMLENMLIAHGRAPFSGSRKVIVAMANAFSWDKPDRKT